MSPTVAFVLGLLAGLAVGALIVAVVVRSTSRVTGAAPRALPGLVLDGLRPARAVDGIAAQRGLARRLKRTSQRTAAGRQVAATSLQVHVSPEAQTAIDAAMGIEAAQADLTEFYAAHAKRAGWMVVAPPALTIVRDISLRPRQAFVRTETTADPAAAPQPTAPPVAAARPPVAVRADAAGVAGTTDVLPRGAAARAAEGAAPTDVLPRGSASRPAARDAAVTDVLPRGAADDAAVTDVLPRGVAGDAAVTDVLPRGMLDEAAQGTKAYPAVPAEHAAAGDLLVVHGTDVRVIPVASGLATVGRAAHNDIVIDAPGVARDHLLLEHRRSAWWVVPGSAAVPATLDGRPVEAPVRIDGQGVVELGRGARLRLTVEPAR